VPALLGRGLEQVVQDLDAIGYDAEWNCISAAWAGGEQARDRVWIVANAKGERVEGLWSQRIEVARPLAQPFLPVRRGDGQWEVEPDLRRSAYGVSTRLDGRVNSWGDRLKQCGNAVCPQIAEMIGRAILSAA
jgi:DNA (cytosine-5)-methyltransferase 1